MKLPILFLDIDGVLNSSRWAIHLIVMTPVIDGSHSQMIDPSARSLLHYIHKKIPFRIVVSSVWRGLGEKTLSKIIGLPVHGVTPHISPGIRGDEIKAWLEENGETATPYVILDDDSDMLEEQKPRFVQTKYENGLTLSDAEVVLSLMRMQIEYLEAK